MWRHFEHLRALGHMSWATRAHTSKGTPPTSSLSCRVTTRLNLRRTQFCVWWKKKRLHIYAMRIVTGINQHVVPSETAPWWSSSPPVLTQPPLSYGQPSGWTRTHAKEPSSKESHSGSRGDQDSNIQICMCCCSVAKLCWTLCDSMNCSTPGFPVLHCLPEFAQTRVHWVGDAIQPSRPLNLCVRRHNSAYNISWLVCHWKWKR